MIVNDKQSTTVLIVTIKVNTGYYSDALMGISVVIYLWQASSAAHGVCIVGFPIFVLRSLECIASYNSTHILIRGGSMREATNYRHMARYIFFCKIKSSVHGVCMV